MKYKPRVAIEYQFVCDVVDATLEGHELSRFDQDSSHGTYTRRRINLKNNFSPEDAMVHMTLTLPSAACAMHLRIVVFPAFGRPMINARNRSHFPRSLCVSESITVFSKLVPQEKGERWITKQYKRS
jgi:hypothetical protein